MKRLTLLCLSVLLLLCSCAGVNPDFRPVASVSEVEEYDDFSCTVVLDEKEVRLSGEAAVELYEMAFRACSDSETLIPFELAEETFTLIFYTGGSDSASELTPYLQPDVIHYGYFVLGADDTGRYSEHVLMSHTTTFQLKAGAYEEIRARAEQLIQE